MYDNLNNELSEISTIIIKKELTNLIKNMNIKKNKINEEIINFSKNYFDDNLIKNSNKNIYDNLNEIKKKLKKDFENKNIKLKNSSVINQIKKNNNLVELKKIETKKLSIIDEIKNQIYFIENLENIINDKNKLFNIKNILSDKIECINSDKKIEEDQKLIELTNEIKNIFNKKLLYINAKIEYLKELNNEKSLFNKYQLNKKNDKVNFSHNNENKKLNKKIKKFNDFDFSQKQTIFNNNYIISFFLILFILLLLFFN